MYSFNFCFLTLWLSTSLILSNLLHFQKKTSGCWHVIPDEISPSACEIIRFVTLLSSPHILMAFFHPCLQMCRFPCRQGFLAPADFWLHYVCCFNPPSVLYLPLTGSRSPILRPFIFLLNVLLLNSVSWFWVNETIGCCSFLLLMSMVHAANYVPGHNVL